MTRPLRIVLTHAYCWPEVRRGAERYVHELGAALQRAGHQVEILSSAPEPSRDTVLGVSVRRLKRRWRFYPRYGEVADQVAFGLEAMAVLAPRRIDVWHAVSTGDGAAAAALGKVRPRLRAVYTEAGFPWRSYRDQREDRGLYAFLMAQVDELICLSGPAADAARSEYGRTAHVVPGGVDLSVFRPGDSRPDVPVLLFPGSLSEPRKNVHLVLEAMALLADRGVTAQLWLVGPGELPSSLSDLATRGLQSVSLNSTASGEELPELFRQAWVTVLPSAAEVFGLVVLESLASGTPAVVLDDGLGPSSLVDETTGVKTAPDSEAIADACVAAIGLARLPTTRAACRRTSEGYDWDTAVVPALLDIYRGKARR